MENDAKFLDELRAFQTALNAKRLRSKALNKNLGAARGATAAKYELSTCSMEETDEPGRSRRMHKPLGPRETSTSHHEFG